jgi:predicted Zn finger-like uncharacterized protein
VEANLTEAITQCPVCQMTFKVTEAQIFIADGSVRCGACLHTFKAEQYFVSPLLDKTEQLAIAAEYWSDFDDYVLSAVIFSSPEPQTDFAEIPGFDQAKIAAAEPELDAEGDERMKFYPDYLVAHRGILPELRPDVSRSSGIDIDVDEVDEVDEDRHFVDLDHTEYLTYSDTREVSGAEVSVDQESGQNLYIDPGFKLPLDDDHEYLLQDRRRLFPASSLKWVPGITLMIAVAIGQVAFFRMSVYAQMTEYRPTYNLVCRYLGCEVPEYENHDELRTRELVIRSHRDEPEALVVDVLLLNSGPYKQAFPGLRLQFYDEHGYVVASRVFRANEYLDGEMRGLKLIPAETEVRLSLELIDPGTNALGYQMEVVPL